MHFKYSYQVVTTTIKINIIVFYQLILLINVRSEVGYCSFKQGTTDLPRMRFQRILETFLAVWNCAVYEVARLKGAYRWGGGWTE